MRHIKHMARCPRPYLALGNELLISFSAFYLRTLVHNFIDRYVNLDTGSSVPLRNIDWYEYE